LEIDNNWCWSKHSAPFDFLGVKSAKDLAMNQYLKIFLRGIIFGSGAVVSIVATLLIATYFLNLFVVNSGSASDEYELL